jgi:DNA invertase Pin-like site-specific DNA recombinase
MLIGYARVSTKDQDRALQIDALKAAGCEKIFEETASGAKTDRPQLNAALDFMREGDVLVVWKLDRLSRSMKQLIDTVEMLGGKGIEFKSLTDAIDTTTPQGRLVFGIFASLAEFERSLIRERTMAGLEAARAKGNRGGRRPIPDAQIGKAASLIAKGVSISEAARLTGLSRLTLYRRKAVTKTSDALAETA